MNEKILIIDDDHETLNFISDLLTQNGYEVILAKDGLDGRTKVWSEKPDLVCLDILLPESSGIKLYHDMRHDEEMKNVPVVIIDDMVDEQIGAGRYLEFERFMDKQSSVPPPEGYIEKPLTSDRILNEVKKVLPSNP